MALQTCSEVFEFKEGKQFLLIRIFKLDSVYLLLFLHFYLSNADRI